MGDTHGDARLLRGTKRKDRKRVDVTVHNLPALSLKETLKLSLIFKDMLVGRYLENSAAERFDFFTRNKCRIGINKKVKLHFTAVNMTVVIHDDGFDAAADHLANNLRYSNRFSHLASTATSKDFNYGKKNDLQISNRPALGDVLQVSPDHAAEVCVVAVGNLPPAGNTRLHCKAL